MDTVFIVGGWKIADLHLVCIAALGSAASSLIIPPIIVALADFVAANMNLGDKSLAYILSVLLQQRWSVARFILSITTVIISVILTVIIGAGIDVEKQRSEPVDISTVSANSVGGEYNRVQGMTSMSLLLNASKSNWPMGLGTHGYYNGQRVFHRTVHTLVPKIPEMGMYMKETGHQSSRRGDVTKATVHDLDGLSYSCTYSVSEKNTSSWEDLGNADGTYGSQDMLKVLRNNVTPNENQTSSSFRFELAFRRPLETYTQLDMDCKIELVQGKFTMTTDLDGRVLMKYTNTSKTKLTLPRRLTGEVKAELGVQLAFAVGYSSTVRWREISRYSEKWNGLVCAISAAHALRAAQGHSIISTNEVYEVSDAESRLRARSTGANWPLFLVPLIHLFVNIFFSNPENLIKGSASQLGSLLADVEGNDLGERELKQCLGFQLKKVRNNRIYWKVVEGESFTWSSNSIMRSTSDWLKQNICLEEWN